MKFLHTAKGNKIFGCRNLAEIFNIEKTAAANIPKEEKSMIVQYDCPVGPA